MKGELYLTRQNVQTSIQMTLQYTRQNPELKSDLSLKSDETQEK